MAFSSAQQATKCVSLFLELLSRDRRLGSVLRQKRERPSRSRIVYVARDEMSMQVRQAITESLVIHLQWLIVRH
jgi:hypothetical protein